MAVALEQLEQMVGTEKTVFLVAIAAVFTVSMALPPPMAKATSACWKEGLASSVAMVLSVESVP